jgi:hypothetical protein
MKVFFSISISNLFLFLKCISHINKYRNIKNKIIIKLNYMLHLKIQVEIDEDCPLPFSLGYLINQILINNNKNSILVFCFVCDEF